MTFAPSLQRSLVNVGAMVALFTAGAATAAEPTVPVRAEIVVASNAGSKVDAGLEEVQKTLARSGLSFTSLTRRSSELVLLQHGKESGVAIGAGHVAHLRLEALEKGTATVRVSVPKRIDATYKVGQHGSVFIHVGAEGARQLMLVLSPPR